jgi:hypothetical protein
MVQRQPKHCYDDDGDGEVTHTLPLNDQAAHSNEFCLLRTTDDRKVQQNARSLTQQRSASLSPLHDTNEDNRDHSIPNKIQRQKRARFRWFLAYTLLYNCRLFHLRKHAKNPPVGLCTERSHSIDEQNEAAAADFQHPAINVEIPEPSESRPRKTKKNRYIYLNKFIVKSSLCFRLTIPTPNISVLPKQRSGLTHRPLSVPESDNNESPQSLAERYITFCLSMLDGIDVKPVDTSPSPDVSQLPLTFSQLPADCNITLEGKRTHSYSTDNHL